MSNDFGCGTVTVTLVVRRPDHFTIAAAAFAVPEKEDEPGGQQYYHSDHK